MKARVAIVALLVTLAAGLPSHAHDELSAGAGAGVSSVVEWATATHRGFAVVGQGGAAGPEIADTVLYAIVIKNQPYPTMPSSAVPRPVTAGMHPYGMVACRFVQKLEAGQFTFDPTLATSTVDVATTPCGPVKIAWTATAPASPRAGAGVSLPGSSFFGSDFSGGHVGIARPAEAVGSFGAVRFGTSNTDHAEINLGAGAGAFIPSVMMTTYTSGFRAMGGSFRHNGITGQIFVGASLARMGTEGTNAFASAVTPAFGCVMLMAPVRVGSRTKMSYEEACGPLTLEMDPAMNEAKITGRLRGMIIDMKLTAAGEPVPENEVEPPATPSVEYPLPSDIIDASLYVSRAATSSGTIRSTRLNTTIRPTLKNAILCQGASARIFRGESWYWLEEGPSS